MCVRVLAYVHANALSYTNTHMFTHPPPTHTKVLRIVLPLRTTMRTWLTNQHTNTQTVHTEMFASMTMFATTTRT